jgi:hypothetical protein
MHSTNCGQFPLLCIHGGSYYIYGFIQDLLATSGSDKEHNKCINRFLDYMWTHPDAFIQYCASDMILNVHSDVFYLMALKVHSRAGDYLFLGSIPCN